MIFIYSSLSLFSIILPAMPTDFLTQMKEAIKKYLPDTLREKAGQFTIPIEFIEQMP